MKKTIAIALFLIAGNSQAQVSYEVSKLEICGKMGGYAVMTQKGALAGTPTSLSRSHSSYLTPILKYIEDTVGTNPQNFTNQEAYNEGWGYCMDKLDRLTRDYKASQ